MTKKDLLLDLDAGDFVYNKDGIYIGIFPDYDTGGYYAADKESNDPRIDYSKDYTSFDNLWNDFKVNGMPLKDVLDKIDW